jgi:FdrA protein
MVTKSLVRKGEYRESIFLMRISQQLEGLDGVKQATVIMATDANKELLKDAGMLTDEVVSAGPNDLAIIVDAESPERADEAISKAGEMMAEAVKERAEEAEAIYKTLDSAASARPDSNLVLISVPGEFAAREAERALKLGKHVMIFSDGVSVEDEVRLKRLGKEKGLLVMGPDCGTSIIGGAGLGFANVVKRGPIGVVAASGTGAQEVTSLVSAGPGISHAIGTGGRDMHDEVGGTTMLMGLETLAGDPETKIIVLVSKPPSPEVAKRVLEAAKKAGKPTVVNFLGGDPKIIDEAGLIPAITLEDAAAKAIALQRGEKPKRTVFSADLDEIRSVAKKEYEKLKPDQRYIRGLYSGGTFCSEGMLIVQELVGDIHSNIPLKPELKLEDSNRSKEHAFVDMGEDEFTAEIGKPHPMIYHELRQKRMLQEASDPETAVLLLDVVLGYGADMDPAGALAPTVRKAKEIAEKDERYLPVVASVCGTPQDPQNLTSQEKKLKEVGVIVKPSNAQAARMAALIATKGEALDKMVEGKS